MMRNAFNYDRDAASAESALFCEDESRTVQSQAEEADINTLVRRFGLTGVMPRDVRSPTYADFDSVFDFRSAMDAVLSAEDSFGRMPADVRLRFGNNPAEFVRFCSREENLEEMKKMGLTKPVVVGDDSPAGKAGDSKDDSK